MINDNTTFDKKAGETIRKKVKKSDFFGIFLIFFGFFGTDFEKMDNFWIILCVFWIMVDNL
jgi:hypothetical protein